VTPCATCALAPSDATDPGDEPGAARVDRGIVDRHAKSLKPCGAFNEICMEI
jgi:hypothetical protein